MKALFPVFLLLPLLFSCTKKPSSDEAVNFFQSKHPHARIVDVSRVENETSCTPFIIQYKSDKEEIKRTAVIYCESTHGSYWSEKDI